MKNNTCNVSSFKLTLDMPAKNLVRVSNEETYSHVYNRGVEGRDVFNDEQDYAVFLDYLREYLTSPPDPATTRKKFTIKGRTYSGAPHQPKNYFNKVELVAYSLKPNHFHLILNQKTAGAQSMFLRSLCTRYSIYFNRKYHRRGSLFDGPYKSAHVKDLSRLPLLSLFIHTHFEKGKDFTQDYSSYAEYVGKRETSWVKPEVVLKAEGKYEDFAKMHNSETRDKNLLDGIMLEEPILDNTPVVVPEPEMDKTLQAASTASNKKTKTRIPEFIVGSTAIFALLFTIGINNISSNSPAVSDVEDKNEDIADTIIITPEEAEVSPAPMVAGAEDEEADTEIPDVAASGSEEATKEAELVDDEIGNEEVKEEVPKTMVVIKINDGSQSVSIRLEPSSGSEKVGEALDGESFELVSKVPGWYRIMLKDGSAYVSAEYVEIEREQP